VNLRIIRGAVVAMALTLAADSCTDQISGSLGCPQLCADATVALRDTILPVSVAIDSTLVGYPVLGDTRDITLLNRGDTADVRFVARFDSLPINFATSAGVDTLIALVDSAKLLVMIDTGRVKAKPPVTIQAFDVDTTANDTLPATLIPLFRADRLLGSFTLTADNFTSDTLSIPLDNSKLLKKVQDTARLRIGLKISGPGSVQMRVLGASFTPRIRFRVSKDTTIKADTVLTRSRTPVADEALQGALNVYPVVAAGALAPPPLGRNAVGGISGARTYIRFNIPETVLDSVQIVRASLYFTQTPSRGLAKVKDSVWVFSHPVLASPVLTDLRTLQSFLGSPYLYGVDSTLYTPTDSGVKTIELVNLLKYWKNVGAANSSRAIVLRAQGEGGQAGDLEFFSIEAVERLRPYLRLTYVPRHGFGLP
jgi:hypothetical protein